MDKESDLSMARRNLFLGGGALLRMMPTSFAFSSDHHGHHGHHSSADDALLKAVYDCMNTSQACLAHCLGEFKKGDSEMADCAQAVQETAAMCDATAKMAALGSQHLKRVAAACMDVCKTCRDSCRTLIKQLKKV